MRTLLVFAPLLVTILFVQLGSGALGPLDALAGTAKGFTPREIGLLGSAHFLGFFAGCVLGPAMIVRAGHSRAFAVLAAIGVISTLAHTLSEDSVSWMLFRVGSGLSVAGSYTVIESWLQARINNSSRGRVLSAYRTVDLMGAVGSQLLIIQLEPTAYASYVVIALIGCLSLIPLSLTTARPPKSRGRPRLRPLKAVLLSPLGAAGVLVVGLTNSSFRMVGPVYGDALALSRADIGFFLAAGMVGGAVAQPGVGWLADKFDRRWVLIFISAAALVVCLTLSTGLSARDGATLALGAFFFGAAAMPLYSVSAAHANDFCPPDFVVELNASLIFLFAVGAIVSPTVAAELIALYGPNALWIYISVAHAALIVFGFYRMTRRPVAAERKPYQWLIRSTMIIGRLFNRSQDGDDPRRDSAEPSQKD